MASQIERQVLRKQYFNAGILKFYLFIYLFIYLFTIFKQACPVQHSWFKWRPVKNTIIQIN